MIGNNTLFSKHRSGKAKQNSCRMSRVRVNHMLRVSSVQIKGAPGVSLDDLQVPSVSTHDYDYLHKKLNVQHC